MRFPEDLDQGLGTTKDAEVGRTKGTHTFPRRRTLDGPERPVVIVGERTGGPSDEAYVKFTKELALALARRLPVVFEPGEPDSAEPARLFPDSPRVRRVLASDIRRRLRTIEPRALIYCSRSSVTLPALVRARLLKRSAGGVPTIMTALQGRRLTGLNEMAARYFWPDLLLVGTEQERGVLSAMGASADRVWGGVDLVKFRPAAAGEKKLLRRRWGLPEDRDVVLHTGHLTNSRNLDYLVQLAKSQPVTVAMAASHRRRPESEQLALILRKAGVTIFDHFLPAIEELYRLADCYVFTPTSETGGAVEMPLSVVEALASGLPVASMRFGALAEHFADTPAVLLCDSPDDLFQAVMHQLRRRPETRGLTDTFSWQRIAERMMTMLDKVAPI